MNKVVPLRKPKEFQVNTTIFTKDNADTPAQVILHDGTMVAVLVRGERPLLDGLDGQGIYILDCPENTHDVWPIAICVIDSAHKQAWENITVEGVNRILDRCARAAERKVAGLPIHNGDA